MTALGFWITQLTVTGPSVPVAEAQFQKGLNVVSGPSNTGKTYMAQCINFSLGGSTPPKSMPDSAGYDTVSVSIRAHQDNVSCVLTRSLRGGDITVAFDHSVRTLLAKHQARREDTVSHFLLELSGLAGKVILRSATQRKTRPLSFRDVARLTFVDEQAMISDRSPIFTGQFTLRTAENAVFRLLLTGVDDSSVVAHVDRAVAPAIRNRNMARVELFDELLEQARSQIRALEIQGSRRSITEAASRIEELLERTSQELGVGQADVAAAEEQRRAAWLSLRQAESRLDVLSELQRRFELLREQYVSDIRRLETIADVGFRLSQMREVRCPLCGASAEHHTREHESARALPQDVANACLAEAQKIKTLLVDLESTVSENSAELARLAARRNDQRSQLRASGDELRTELQPRVAVALGRLLESQSERDGYRRALVLYQRVDELERMRSEVSVEVDGEAAEGLSAVVRTHETEEFTGEVESLLRSWQFPAIGRVTFSEEDQDVIVSGRPRASHGKGVRAITHAAFNLALLKHCDARGGSHPGLVVLDSPLVVYRQPDTDEGGFAPAVKDAFYRSLVTAFQDRQVLIFENEDPPEDLGRLSTTIKFTGAAHGRQGFFPRRT